MSGPPPRLVGWLDVAAGASGDMLLGALVDAGVPLAHLQSTVDAVLPGGPRLVATGATRHGLAGTRVTVTMPPGPPPPRTAADIRRMLDAAALAEPIRAQAGAVFDRLARAEAAVHGVDPDLVHLHEVGALDAIADIVGTCAGFCWLAVHRGLSMLHCGPLEIGAAGTARSGHGTVPVPAPAVLEIARDSELTVTGRLPHEACTPTGAALLVTLTRGTTALPAMRVRTVAVGAGSRDPAEVPNVLRLVLGEPAPQHPGAHPGPAASAEPGTSGAADPPRERAMVIECNVDDLDPRLWPAVLGILLAGGADDAWLTPVLMKKGRPAHLLSVLCPPAAAAGLRRLIYRHTSTIGLRQWSADKYPLDRSSSTVDVGGRQIRVKLARLAGRVVNAGVEYDDVLAAADALDLPAKVVLARANAAAAGLADRSDPAEEGQGADDA